MKLFIFLLFLIGSVMTLNSATSEFGSVLLALGFISAIFYANERTRASDVEDTAESIALAVQKINKETNSKR